MDDTWGKSHLFFSPPSLYPDVFAIVHIKQEVSLEAILCHWLGNRSISSQKIVKSQEACGSGFM